MLCVIGAVCVDVGRGKSRIGQRLELMRDRREGELGLRGGARSRGQGLSYKHFKGGSYHGQRWE